MGSSRLRWVAEVMADALAVPEQSADPASQVDPVQVGVTLSGVTVSPERDISIDVTMAGTTEGVLVSGSIQAHWQGPCSRCMIPVDGQIDITVRELFSTAPIEGEHYPLEPEHVDLTSMVREAILLELPVHAVPCPNPAPCPNLPAELQTQLDPAQADSAQLDPTQPSQATRDPNPRGKATEEGGEQDRQSEQTKRDPRWAALDVLRTDTNTGTDTNTNTGTGTDSSSGPADSGTANPDHPSQT